MNQFLLRFGIYFLKFAFHPKHINSVLKSFCYHIFI